MYDLIAAGISSVAQTVAIVVCRTHRRHLWPRRSEPVLTTHLGPLLSLPPGLREAQARACLLTSHAAAFLKSIPSIPRRRRCCPALPGAVSAANSLAVSISHCRRQPHHHCSDWPLLSAPSLGVASALHRHFPFSAAEPFLSPSTHRSPARPALSLTSPVSRPLCSNEEEKNEDE